MSYFEADARRIVIDHIVHRTGIQRSNPTPDVDIPNSDLPHGTRIVNKMKDVNRVVYDVTPKPPGMIEWTERLGSGRAVCWQIWLVDGC